MNQVLYIRRLKLDLVGGGAYSFAVVGLQKQGNDEVVSLCVDAGPTLWSPFL